MEKLTEFDYLLNRMEHAAQQETPADHHYGTHRASLLRHVRALEKDQERLRDVLMRVQNLPSHPGGHPDDRSADADDAASWRHGWICAVEAMQGHALPNAVVQAGGATTID